MTNFKKTRDFFFFYFRKINMIAEFGAAATGSLIFGGFGANVQWTAAKHQGSTPWPIPCMV